MSDITVCFMLWAVIFSLVPLAVMFETVYKYFATRKGKGGVCGGGGDGRLCY